MTATAHPPVARRISARDETFIDYLRGLSILRVVLAHLGLSWIFPPYSEFVMALLPILFFVSGAVSFFSFRRASSSGFFLLRRALMLTIPVYVLAVIGGAVRAVMAGSVESFEWIYVLSWLLLNPGAHMMPFELGQIWFLRALLIITFLAIPVFVAARRSDHALLVPVLLSTILVTLQLFHDIADSFYRGGFNFYQPLANMGFFFFGAWYFAQRARGVDRVSWLITAGLLGLSVATGSVVHPDVGLADHTYSPNLYYVAASYFAICLAVRLQPVIEIAVGRFTWVERGTLFFSRHAFSVYLLHSFVLIVSERSFGLVDVMGDPIRAATKVGFVVVGSMVAAIPLTWLSRLVRARALALCRVG